MTADEKPRARYEGEPEAHNSNVEYLLRCILVEVQSAAVSARVAKEQIEIGRRDLLFLWFASAILALILVGFSSCR